MTSLRDLRAKMSCEKALCFLFLSYALLLIFTPIFLSGDLHITIHDNLDSSIVWLKSMRANNAFFDFDSSLPFLGGLSRHYLPSELQLNNVIFNWMPAIDAYTLSYLLKAILGTVSFFLLLRKYFEKKHSATLFCCAFTYSILPVYPNLYFAQATIPLFVYLLLSYTEKPSLKLTICLLLFPTLSELPRIGIFLLSYAALYFLYSLLRKKKNALYSLTAILLFSISYLVTEYHLIYQTFVGSGESIRSEFSPIDKGGVLEIFTRGFRSGQYHATIPTLPVFPNLPFYTNYPIAFYCTIFYYVFSLWKKTKYKKASFCLIACIVANTLLFTMNESQSLKTLLSSFVGGLGQWNFGRFIWLNPFLWIMILATICVDISQHINKSFIYLLLLANLAHISTSLVPYNDLANTIRDHPSKKESLTYDQFFSTQDFSKLKKEIKYHGEPSLAFGMHPSILVFNDIKTLDMYHSGYNLSYKHKFRNLISPTLDKNNSVRRYFDNWGGRAYLFSKDGLKSFAPTLSPNPLFDNSEIFIDVKSASEMNLKYIFSRYKISNPLENSLSQVAKTKGEVYNIYAYEFTK